MYIIGPYSLERVEFTPKVFINWSFSTWYLIDDGWLIIYDRRFNNDNGIWCFAFTLKVSVDKWYNDDR
jgi:hypothetical protein